MASSYTGQLKASNGDLALERLHELIALMPALALPEEAAEAYGTIRAELESKGDMIASQPSFVSLARGPAGTPFHCS